MFAINKTLITNLFGFALISVVFFLPEIVFALKKYASEQTIDLTSFQSDFSRPINLQSIYQIIIHVGISCWTLLVWDRNQRWNCVLHILLEGQLI